MIKAYKTMNMHEPCKTQSAGLKLASPDVVSAKEMHHGQWLLCINIPGFYFSNPWFLFVQHSAKSIED